MSNAITRKAMQLLMEDSPENSFGLLTPRHTEVTNPSSTPCCGTPFGRWKRTMLPGLRF